MNKSFNIVAARHGGFLVLEDGFREVVMRAPMFAGELGPCLDFLRSQFEPREAEPSDLAKAS